MATETDAPEADDQDRAETYDEEVSLGDDSDSVGLDVAADVYDSTRARGDEDTEGDDDALDADEEDDELLDGLGDAGDDEDDLDDDEVDALDEDDLSDADLDADDEEDPDAVDAIGAHAADEAEVISMDDLETDGIETTGGRTADYESDTLSDDDLKELDYEDPATGATRGGGDDVETGAPGRGATPDHARDDDAAVTLKPDDLDPSHHDHPDRQSDRLDEGLEETFPGSDPVSVKHIT